MRRSMINVDIEKVARALCVEAGDDPDSQTYAHAMRCTGRSDAPEFRWMYWIPFAKVAISAIGPVRT